MISSWEKTPSYRILGPALLAMAFVLLAVINLPVISDLQGDVAVYRAAAALRDRGVPLYQGFFDHKGPFFHEIYYLSHRFNGGVWGVWLFETLLIGLSALLMYRALAKRFEGFLPVVWQLGLMVVSVLYYYPDGLSMELIALSLALTIGWGENPYVQFLNGVLAVCVFLSKSTFVGFYMALGIWLLGNPRTWNRALPAYVAGGLVSLGVSVGLLAAKGILPAFWDCCIHFNALYAADLNHASSSWLGVLRHCKNVLPLALLCVYPCWRLKAKVGPPLLVAWLFFLFWSLWSSSKAIIGPNGTAAARLAFYLPSLFLIAMLDRSQQTPREEVPCRRSTIRWFFLVAMGLYFTFAPGVLHFFQTQLIRLGTGRVSSEGEEKNIYLAQYLNTLPDAPVLSIGMSGLDLYSMTNRVNAIPYCYGIPFLIDGYLTEDRLDDLIRQIDDGGPSVFVDYPGGLIGGVMDPELVSDRPFIGKIRHIPFLAKLRAYLAEHHFEAKVFDDGVRVFLPNEWRDLPEVSQKAEQPPAEAAAEDAAVENAQP